jgi:orotidine-5'-phosphate decarboxylase
MEKTFKEKWLEAVENKNSVLCAGLDPAEFSMEREGKGLPEGVNKKKWALDYIKAVAPFCAAVKPNFQYWKSKGDINSLHAISKLSHDLGLVVIDDSKLADIGSTNDAGIFYAAQRADAVTFSPFAGNMKEASEQAKSRKIGIIGMCLMSNPEYEREKNKLVDMSKDDEWKDFAINDISSFNTVKQYLQLAFHANKFGLEGIVVGAPSSKNHIEESEIKKISYYFGNNGLILLPGVGAQGGEADTIWKYFGKNNVIVNVSRSLMLPKGSNSTTKQQAETARQYRDMLNELRTKN